MHSEAQRPLEELPRTAGGGSPAVPALLRRGRQPTVSPSGSGSSRSVPPLLTPAARKAILQRMMQFPTQALDRISALTGASSADLRRFRHELTTSGLPEQLVTRGAGPAFVQELPQGALLYLLVRASRPERAVETGVRPGYSTAWILAALDANGSGELISLGPGGAAGRVRGVHEVTVGQFVAPALRTHWTLELGNTRENFERIVASGGRAIDLFFYDNGPDTDRAWFELRTAWQHLSDRGVLLAHHVDANPVWGDFCERQGLPPQILDSGPPPLGALAVRRP